MCDARFDVLELDDVEDGAPDKPFSDAVWIPVDPDVHCVLLDNRGVGKGSVRQNRMFLAVKRIFVWRRSAFG